MPARPVQQHQDTFANLVANNPVIPAGEVCIASDVPDMRIGDGTRGWLDLSSSFAPGAFGDGSDGDVTIAGTVTLTRDMYYRNLTVPAGTTLATAGFVVFVQNALTWAGTISANGNSAVLDVAGAQVLGRATATVGMAGGTGAGAAGVGSANPAFGGNGGAGGLGASGAGGGGGFVTSVNAARGSNRELGWILPTTTVIGSNITAGSGGAGGGDGTNKGGGSGGSGGLIWIIARQVTYVAGCIASAVGGNGGNAAAGNCGGGGGGGGGGALVVYLSKVGSLTTQTFTGGTGGTKTGTGVNGVNGSAGSLLERRLL